MAPKVVTPIVECITVGACTGCHQHRALRHGRCLDCEQAANNSPRGEGKRGAA